MNRVASIRNFAKYAIGEQVIIARDRNDWGMSLTEKHPRLVLPQDLNQNHEEDKLFRKDFIRRFKGGQGFANVTISILHELGHWATRLEVNWDEYWAEQENVYGLDYFNLKAERIATDWAIAWLQNSQNRRVAKAFEKEFFGY